MLRLVELLEVREEQRNEEWWDELLDAIEEERELEMEIRMLVIGC